MEKYLELAKREIEYLKRDSPSWHERLDRV